MNTIEILEWMIKEYDKRGGGYSQKEALKEAIKALNKNPLMTDNQLINIILDWMREMGYGDKDGHSPAMILAKKIIEDKAKEG